MFPKNDQISPKSTYEIKYKSQGVPGGPKKYSHTAQTMAPQVFGCVEVISGISGKISPGKSYGLENIFFNPGGPHGTSLLEPVNPAPITGA